MQGRPAGRPYDETTMNKYNPDIHHRHSIRLKDYDYSKAGAYFVTACAWRRECLFGDVVDGEMKLNGYGNIVQACWDDLPYHYPRVVLDVFTMMPNHVHGVIVLNDAPLVGAGFNPAPTNTIVKRHGLSEIMRVFKTFSSRRINALRNNPGHPVWQRNYYEHVIRTEDSLNRIREYIRCNPTRWDEDIENPALWDEKKAKTYYKDIVENRNAAIDFTE